MSAARAEVLRRIRAALGPAPAVPEVPRAYRGASGRAAAVPTDAREVPRAPAAADQDAVALFCERVADYRATVHRVAASQLPALLGGLCAGARLGLPAGLPWAVDGAELVADEPPLAVRDLDALDGALTGCALAIAETGTIVPDGGPRSGRRPLPLVPDRHVCVVEAAQVVASVPDAIAALDAVAREGRPLTFVSGPSATSDIELERVEGVHGPRRLEVVVVE